MRKIISKIAGALLGLSLVFSFGAFSQKQNSSVGFAANNDEHSIASFTGQGEDVILNNGVTPDTISIADPGYPVKQVIIGWSHNKNNAGITASVTIGSESLGSGTVGGTKTTTTTTIGDGNTSLSGAIEITWSSTLTSTGNGTLTLNTLTLIEGWSGSVTNYTISYNANGGGGSMSDTVGPAPTVVACSFTAPEGKVFSRWNTAANGLGTDYAVGTSVSADLSLYAIWSDKPAYITLDQIGDGLPGTANTSIETTDVIDGSDTYTLNYYQCKYQLQGTNKAMFLTKSTNAFISNHTEIPRAIVSVDIYVPTGASGSATYDIAFGTTEFTTATAGIGAVNISASSHHEFTSNLTNAKYFCITLGSDYNGQIYKIVVNYSSVDPTLETLTIKANGVEADSASMNFSIGNSLFYAYDSNGEVTGCEWAINNTSIATLEMNGNNVPVVTFVKGGTVIITASKSGYNQGSFSLTINIGELQTITVTGSMSDTTYYVGESWSAAGCYCKLFIWLFL